MAATRRPPRRMAHPEAPPPAAKESVPLEKTSIRSPSRQAEQKSATRAAARRPHARSRHLARASASSSAGPAAAGPWSHERGRPGAPDRVWIASCTVAKNYPSRRVRPSSVAMGRATSAPSIPSSV